MDKNYAYDIDSAEEGELGTPIQFEHPYIYNQDLEQFIMGLPLDEGRVLVARALGYEGKEAARIAGFKSIWIYIRKLKKLQMRMKSQVGVLF